MIRHKFQFGSISLLSLSFSLLYVNSRLFFATYFPLFDYPLNAHGQKFPSDEDATLPDFVCPARPSVLDM